MSRQFRSSSKERPATLALFLVPVLAGFLFSASALAVDEVIPATIAWGAYGAGPVCDPPAHQYATTNAALQCLIQNADVKIEYTGEIVPKGPGQTNDYWFPANIWDNFPALPKVYRYVVQASSTSAIPSCPAGYYSPELVNGTWTCRIQLQVFDQTLKPCDLCVGNPIFPGTGNKRQQDTDYVGVGSFPLTLSRIYNSAPQFGLAWKTNYHRLITYSSIGSTTVATLHRAQGSYAFRQVGSAWVPDSDVNYKLTGSNGNFVVMTPDGDRERYDGNNYAYYIETGSASAMKYRLTYTSDAAHLLMKVNDAFGHALNLTYDAQNRLVSMTDPNGALYQYGYDASSNLTTVTYPDGKVRQYVYNESVYTAGANLPRALTGIIDENAIRFATFGYNAFGLAILSEHAGGIDRYAVNYGTPPAPAYDVVIDVPNHIKRVTIRQQPPTDVTVADALGATRSYGFVAINGAVKTSGSSQPCIGACTPIGQSQLFDANGNVTSKTDFNGNLTTFGFDLSRNLETSRTEAASTPNARTITTQWHPTYRVPTQIDEPGKRTTFTHDANGNVLTKTETDTASSVSRTWTFTYNSFGQMLTANGPRTDVSDITTYTYYGCTTGYQCGQVNTVTNALGQVTTFLTYSAHGQPLTIQDPNGVVTTLTYDARQRLTSRTTNSELTGFDYFPTGLLKKVTLPDSSFVSYSYDAAHRLIGMQDSEGHLVTYTLDLMGNRTKEETFDPTGVLSTTRSRVFDTLSRLSKKIDAAGTPAVTTTWGYDANGNQTTTNAPLGRNATNSYDELNRVKQVTDPVNGNTVYGYNALDQLISVTDPRNLATTYTYNALGDLTQQESPDTGTSTNTFDSGGNVRVATDARSKTATYTYDALNRPTQVAYGDQTLSYGYDVGTNGVGRLTSSSDANYSNSWSYDSLGRVTSKTQTLGTIAKTVGYGYTNGLLASVTTPYGATIAYTYTHGKVTGISINGAALLSTVLYEPFGPTRGWTWGNGTLAVRDYDQDGKVTLIDSAGLNTYQYDDAFRITQITDSQAAANSWTYGYDPQDRLTNATKTGTSQGFSYDADGNRLSQTGTANTTLTYPATSNRLQSAIGSGTKTYTYDTAGNITSDGTIVYTYNNRGRMKTAKNGTAAAVTYTYDGMGQRIKKTGTTRFFVYDEAGHLLGEYNASGTMVQEFVWMGDIPVAVLTPKTGGVNVFYIHTDHLNTPRKITRPTDNKLRWTWNPTPFGTGAPNENPQALGAFVFPLRFPGMYADTETGNFYNYFRTYSPELGRYLESDPIGLAAGVNTYAYVGGNPLSRYDSLGLDAIPIVFPEYRPALPGNWPLVRGKRPFEFGHAGVLLFNPQSGFTRYYEYGRYENLEGECGCGAVRSYSVPNLAIGKNGQPTKASLNRVLSRISATSGGGTRISAVHIPNPNFEAMNAYGQRRRNQNSNPNRAPYEFTGNNCSQFVFDVLNAGGVDDLPLLVNPSPANMIDELLEEGYSPITWP
jgi:RHS repeat-associated protein